MYVAQKIHHMSALVDAYTGRPRSDTSERSSADVSEVGPLPQAEALASETRNKAPTCNSWFLSVRNCLGWVFGCLMFFL